MKKIFLMYIILFISCGRDKEEQMFYEFMDIITIKEINMSVKDLDLKIIMLNKVGVVYAKDSLDILTKDLSELKNNLEEDYTFIKENLEKKERI